MEEEIKERICHICGTKCIEWCPTCVANFEKRRNAQEMTKEERVQELNQLIGPLEMPFDLLHQRIEELVGRGVFTHELAFPEMLIDEIDSGNRGEAFKRSLIALKKKTIIVTPDEKGGLKVIAKLDLSESEEVKKVQAVHIRFKGNSYDTNLEELGISGTPSDSDLKNAVARHLDVATAEVNDLAVERTADGSLILRPNAPFG